MSSTTTASTQPVTIAGGYSFNGHLKVPGDKSIAHRALMIAALGQRPCEIWGLADGQDVHHTRQAVEALGAHVEDLTDNAVRVTGGLTGTSEPIFLGNSGTSIRLLAGMVAGFDFNTILDGDASIRRRPMARVIEPLTAMGGSVQGSGPEGSLAPLSIHGRRLRGVYHSLPVASAQVKSALLLAGLQAQGTTTVHETQLTRTHTEEMLVAAGAKLQRNDLTVTIWPGPLDPSDIHVPGDPSQAAFWLVGACMTPDSNLTVSNVYLGPARDGFLEVLQSMGADIDVDSSSGDIRARSSVLTATRVAADKLPRCIDEVPILAVAAAASEGVTVFEGVEELRVKESDRVAAIVDLLVGLGVDCQVLIQNGRQCLGVSGIGNGQKFKSAIVNARADHRIAMAAAIAGAVCVGSVTVEGFESTATSYPGFARDLTVVSGTAVVGADSNGAIS
ncbi:MAG: 3-phosphoshikimate 1-carboxyvinyltransferase [Acidimicrobiia bacterium]|nr:3-phosphoshikimate 1-carboxyvinyltransferase [Acidimicrobiia bacterium]MYC58436.1 3-phosphoshikimate 1-carboxyvinyltransferase [Acidimicrobiia bacterium]MYI30458.1 3-phosphoshikimate 1-carboxyvinyltransferase [Acidimicrobiia bacterium]